MQKTNEEKIWEILTHLFRLEINKNDSKVIQSSSTSIFENIRNVGWNLTYSFFKGGNTFDPEETIYQKLQIFSKTYEMTNENRNEIIDKLIDKFFYLIYFCYRKNIKFDNSSLKSDTGWGCMIRSYQMLLSRAFYKILRDERYNKWDSRLKTLILFQDTPIKFNEISETLIPYFNKFYRILKEKNFQKPEEVSIVNFLPPFSIQSICYIGETFFNVTTGQWFGDVVLGQIMTKINDDLILNGFCHMISFQTNVILPHLISKCFVKKSEYTGIPKDIGETIIFEDSKDEYVLEKPIIIFVHVRLGIQNISPEYLSSMKHLFTFKGCLGILGGKVNSAFYFIGYFNEENFVYMDPHITRDSVRDLNNKEQLTTHFDKEIHYLKFRHLQPSFTIGFLIKNIKEFQSFKAFCEEHSKREYPCFGFLTKEEEIAQLNEEHIEKIMEGVMNDKDDF